MSGIAQDPLPCFTAFSVGFFGRGWDTKSCDIPTGITPCWDTRSCDVLTGMTLGWDTGLCDVPTGMVFLAKGTDFGRFSTLS